jgi:hypothetical protein
MQKAADSVYIDGMIVRALVRDREVFADPCKRRPSAKAHRPVPDEIVAPAHYGDAADTPLF